MVGRVGVMDGESGGDGAGRRVSGMRRVRRRIVRMQLKE